MKRGVWYFDFVSPFAYLHAKQLDSLPCRLQPRPVLFAALLRHWGQRGPAEIPGKRVYTYRYVQWLSKEKGVAFRMPMSHPFNPLPYLRLAIAQRCDWQTIGVIFDMLYTTGIDPASSHSREEISRSVGVIDGDAVIAQQWVKDELRENVHHAVAAGVFGVPTVVLDGLLFWGEDSLPMLRAYLENPNLFASGDMRRLETIKPSASRDG